MNTDNNLTKGEVLMDLSTKQKAEMFEWLDENNDSQENLYEAFAEKFNVSQEEAEEIIDNGWAVSRGFDKDIYSKYQEAMTKWEESKEKGDKKEAEKQLKIIRAITSKKFDNGGELKEGIVKTLSSHHVFGGEAYIYSKGDTVIGFIYKIDGEEEWKVWGGLDIPQSDLNQWLDEETEAKHTAEGWGGVEKTFDEAEYLLEVREEDFSKTYNIKYWETQEERDNGESHKYMSVNSKQTAILSAKSLYNRQDAIAVEVEDEDGNLVYHLSIDGEEKYANGGGVGENFYKGQSIYIEPIVHSEELKKALPQYNNYANKELVIEKIEYDTPFKRAKAFVRETGEKVPFDIFLNKENVKQYANGGGVGLSEDEEKRLKELEDKKEKLKLELLDVSMGIKGGKKQIEDKLGSINDEINNLLKKKYNWKGQYALGGFLSDAELDEASKKINNYIQKSGVHIWERKNKRYVPIEVWQYAGQLLQIYPRVVMITPVEDKKGYLAKAEAINNDGTVISTGFGYVDRNEGKWANSQEYELISFAQTRAVSRVLRNAISYIIRYAGYSTTPAEEMYSVTDDKKEKFKGKSKGVVAEPLKEGEYDFILDKPEFRSKSSESEMFKKEEETFEPITKSKRHEGPENLLLMDLYSQANAEDKIIISQEFMDIVAEELVSSYDEQKRGALLGQAYDWLIENNIQIGSSRFMNKIKKYLSENKFRQGGVMSQNEIIEEKLENHIVEEIKPIIGDYDDYEIEFESHSADKQTKQVLIEFKGVDKSIIEKIDYDYDAVHNEIKALCDKYDLYFTSILTMEDGEQPSITLVFNYFF